MPHYISLLRYTQKGVESLKDSPKRVEATRPARCSEQVRRQRVEEAHAALLAASRGGEPRAAEAARELLPNRYPYVYEFRKAIASVS